MRNLSKNSIFILNACTTERSFFSFAHLCSLRADKPSEREEAKISPCIKMHILTMYCRNTSRINVNFVTDLSVFHQIQVIWLSV